VDYAYRTHWLNPLMYTPIGPHVVYHLGVRPWGTGLWDLSFVYPPFETILGGTPLW
jgi:hypothetical protein